jgi:hypothetical protein
MEEFQIKRGFTKDLDKNMVQQLIECFNVEPVEADGHYTITFGALKRFDVSLGTSGKTVVIDIEADPSIEDDQLILDTIRRRNAYLLAVTGFSAKERVKKAKKIE